MASRNAAIADAVVSLLSAGVVAHAFGTGVTFTPARVYLPLKDAKDLTALAVLVYPAGDKSERLSRSATALHEVAVQVGIYQRLPASTDPTAASANTTIDAFAEIGEKIADYFTPGQYGGATFVKTETPAIVDHEFLHEKRIMFSVIVATFQLIV